MSNEELEVYVALVAKFMQLSPEQRDLISGELQDHLQMRVEDLIHEGVSKSDAISQAVEEFGDAAVMAKNFQTVHNLKKRRWMMRFMTFSIAGSFLVAVLTMAMWPQNARFGSPSKLIAQQNDWDNPFDNPRDPKVKTVSDPAPKKVKPNALAPAHPKGKPTASDSTQRNQRTEAKLKQNVNFDYDEAPFSEIMEELGEQMGLNFILTPSASNDALPKDETITSNISGMPLGKALDLILAPKNATYVIDSGAILFISLDEADDECWHRVKMFDCRELVKVLPKTAPPVKLFLPRYFGGGGGGGGFGSGGGGGGFGGGGGGVFSIAPSSQQPQPQTGNNTKKQTAKNKPSESQILDAKFQQIITMMEQEATRRRPEPTAEYTLETLVYTMTESGIWCQQESPLKVVNGILVVRGSEAKLKQIENLLVDLKGKLLDK